MTHDTERAIRVLAMLGSAILETVQESGEMGCPAGILYAGLMSFGISLNTFQAIMSGLVQSGKLRYSGHVYYKGEE